MRPHRQLIDLKTQKRPSLFLFGVSCMFAAFCGSQFVHLIYRPMDDVSKLVDEEYKKIVEQAEKNKSQSS